MKFLVAMSCLVMAFALPVAAQDKSKGMDHKSEQAKEKSKAHQPSEKQKAQQDRMKSCNEKAGSMKGDERQKYMSACLKGETPAAAKPMTQQEKMTACNKEASGKNMKGDDRKKFMSACLKG